MTFASCKWFSVYKCQYYWALESCLHASFRASTYKKGKPPLTADVLHHFGFQMSQLSKCLFYIQITVVIFQVIHANINYQHVHLTLGLKQRQCLLCYTIRFIKATRHEQSFTNPPSIFKDNLKWDIFSKAAWDCMILWLCSYKQYLVVALHVLLKTVMSYKLFKRCWCWLKLVFFRVRSFRNA